MNSKRIDHTIAALAFGGVAFSGYLSSVKFFSETCAFGETCPYFMGYPACYFGFAMFALLFALAVIRAYGWCMPNHANAATILVATLGTAFAGYFTSRELPTLFADGFTAYVLGLPTCALGLIVFSAVLALSIARRNVSVMA